MSREQENQEHEELLEALDEAEAKIDEITGQIDPKDESNEAGPGDEEGKADPESGEITTENNGDDQASIIQNLEQQVQELSAKADDHYDQFVRTRADMENLRRRTDRELTNAHKYAVEKLAKELLAVVDSLELGIQASSGDDPEIQKLREGSELTLKLLTDVMEKFNIKPVGAIGDKFDPEFHQAMTTQPSNDTEPDTVVQVMQKGYQIHDRLLRPALVIVSKPE
ncbi:MAG: nucleotide exchange factor GrpE [Gammaproteobacteria bacterium]|nr:nucleotide exchange factor GrpE [Gammaproteobacteria bacterium]